MQDISACLTGGSICLLYIIIVIDLAVGVVVCNAHMLKWWRIHLPYIYICLVLYLAVVVVVCKASLLNWLGVCLPSIYMHCTISSIWCSSMQGFCAQLTGGSRSSSGCSGTQGIYAQLMGVHLPSIYMHCTISEAEVVCKASVVSWQGV